MYPHTASDDMIKVEVWDIIDPKRNEDEFATEENVAEGESKAVHSDLTPNYYRNAHAVILMVDPTRKWTFEYVQQELTKIPDGLETLLLVSNQSYYKSTR